ncbi:SWIB/MDM2 domain-containing protein [Lipomyces arxii]|uniref:SWIB/MDM2 domain-containing protein n=1 Tax=Lipomyces arxii TaxID=56418 RepID=UPI0034CF5DA3
MSGQALRTTTDLAQYLPTIDAILRVADPDKVSAKRLRNAIEDLFDVDLSAYKKQLDATIVDRFNQIQDEIEQKRRNVEGASTAKANISQANAKQVQAKQDKAARKKKLIPVKAEVDHEKSDAELAAKLHGEINLSRTRNGGPARSSTRGQRAKKNGNSVEKKPRSVNRNSVFHATNLLSPQLAELLGETELSRPAVVQKVFKYVNDNQLKNPNDGRWIICDDKMRPVFGNTVTYFGVNKILSKHLRRKES